MTDAGCRLGRGAALALLLLALGACATTGPVGLARGEWRDQLHRVPEPPGVTLSMRVCRPLTDAPSPAVIINHGTPDLESDRIAMQPAACTSAPAQWFLARGYVVGFPLRRGHGDTTKLLESSGTCAAPNYVQAGLIGATDIAAAVDYITALPYVRPDHAVVVGQSTGGWATIAYASLPHPRVSGLISMAGGRGGRAGGVAGQTCRADLLAYSAAYFATTAHTPMLWIYAANDSNFAPDTARTMAQSYQAAGGALEFEPVPAFDGDGHTLFFAPGGATVWGPLVAHYLSTL